MTQWIRILELIGGAAFALSGAATAMEHGLDIFGLLVLALTTAAGGGVLRDLLLGQTPPAVFSDPLYIAVCLVATVLFAAVISAAKRGRRTLARFEGFINIADAAGLGIFAVLGSKASLSVRPDFIMAVFIGTLTAVGGGIMRDTAVAVPPLVFRKRIYAVAAIAGSALYCALYEILPQWAVIVLSLSAVITIRVLASRFRWDLSVIRFDGKDKPEGGG